jgi:putative cardiolipin synthase
LPLTWARAQLVYDSPDKKKVKSGAMSGRLMQGALANITMEVRSELLMVTPYLIPGNDGMRLLKDLRRRNVRVRILTNSLETSEQLLAHSGYMHYRVPLLENDIELYEIRALLGNTKGSGQTAAISRHGNY